MKAMLATTLEPNRWLPTINDPAWVIEPKYDGIRTLVHISGGSASWLNRQGDPLTKPTPEDLTATLKEVPGTLVLDGELLQGKLFVFDLPVLGDPLYHTPLQQRRQALREIVEAIIVHPHLVLSPQAGTRAEKQEMINRAVQGNWEGLMLKDLNGFYLPGKRSEMMLKFKFTRTIDCIIGHKAVDGKNNATLYLKDDEVYRQVGKCSLNGKEPVEIGDVVEVRFLYTGENQRLVQPRMLRKRTDKQLSECTTDQLIGTSSVKNPT